MATRKLFLSALVFGLSTLPMVSTVSAQDRDERARQQERRYYDSVQREYHPWTAEESRRYHEFINERHLKYREFSRQSKKNQRAYWQWRHDHDVRDERR